MQLVMTQLGFGPGSADLQSWHPYNNPYFTQICIYISVFISLAVRSFWSKCLVMQSHEKLVKVSKSNLHCIFPSFHPNRKLKILFWTGGLSSTKNTGLICPVKEHLCHRMNSNARMLEEEWRCHGGWRGGRSLTSQPSSGRLGVVANLLETRLVNLPLPWNVKDFSTCWWNSFRKGRPPTHSQPGYDRASRRQAVFCGWWY